MQVQHQERNWVQIPRFVPTFEMAVLYVHIDSFIHFHSRHPRVHLRTHFLFHSARDLKISRKQVDRCRSWASIWSQVQMAPNPLDGVPHENFWTNDVYVKSPNTVTSKGTNILRAYIFQNNLRNFRCFIFLHKIPPPTCHLCHPTHPSQLRGCMQHFLLMKTTTLRISFGGSVL